MVTVDPDAHTIALPFDLEEAYSTLVSEAWRKYSRRRNLGPRELAFYYRTKRLIPRGVQLRARRALARWQSEPEFPAWPLDESVDELLRLHVRCHLVASGRDSIQFRWFWPEGKASAFILTHDVESEEGLRRSLEIADLEDKFGLRSSFNIVASWYPIDMGIVDELKSRGFEIGVHGIYHDRSMFASRDQFEAQQPSLRDATRRFGAVGFRSPATHRVFDWLAELPVEYDCSVPHSDPYEPQPGGCCSLWPFFIGDVVELPYTLPQDHTLFTVLGRPSNETWLRAIDAIVESNGLIQIVSHPDPGYLGDSDKRAMYAATLDAISRNEELWHALPRDVARWWRQRDAGSDGPYQTTVGEASLRGGRVEFARRASASERESRSAPV